MTCTPAPSSLYRESKLASYRQIRSASHGAGISLLNKAGEYEASFDCALAVFRILGNRNLLIIDEVPTYKIPTAEMQSALAKLAQRYSVALVDVVAERDELKFVCVWRVESTGGAVEAGDPMDGF